MGWNDRVSGCEKCSSCGALYLIPDQDLIDNDLSDTPVHNCFDNTASDYWMGVIQRHLILRLVRPPGRPD